MELNPFVVNRSVDQDHEQLKRLKQRTLSREQHRDPICVGCNKPLGDLWFQNSFGELWHPPCFLCTGCQEPIKERQFQVHGRDPYHQPCYKKKFDPICEVCYDYIPINVHSGMIEWRFHPFWGTKYCPAHEADQTARCGSCERMQPRDERYTILDGRRKLCPQCSESIIMDSKAGQKLYHSVRDFYRQLGLNIEQNIPLLLVDRGALKAAAEKDGYHHFEPDARGICLAEERMIETCKRSSIARPEAARECVQPAGIRSRLKYEPQQSIQKSVVTGILVLFGFPRLLTGSIVAHEVMHAWLKLSSSFPSSSLRSEVEEGMCQFMAYLWLQSQVGELASNSLATSQFECRLGQCLMQQIEKHDSPVYGAGFLAAQAAIAKHGLPKTIHHITTTDSVISPFGAATRTPWINGQQCEELGKEIASNPAQIRTDLKDTIVKERERLRKKSEALDAAEAVHDEAVEAMSSILVDEDAMDAMVAYGKNKDTKNKKGKAISEKYRDLTRSMSPAVKARVRQILLERIKLQYKKDAKGAEKFMKETLGKLFPDMLQDYFRTHDYNKGKGPEN